VRDAIARRFAHGEVPIRRPQCSERETAARAVDLLTAAAALAAELPLYTRTDDFDALDHLIEVVVI